MKIALLTWHSSYNPGTHLQCRGLLGELLARGHEVRLVDYRPQRDDYLPRGVKYYLQSLPDMLRKKAAQSAERAAQTRCRDLYSDELARRDQRYATAWAELPTTPAVASNDDFSQLSEQYDVFVAGSDQIWNPTLLNRRYLLDFVRPGKTRVAHGCSSGCSTFGDTALGHYRRYVGLFDHVAVREEALAKTLRGLLPGKDVRHVVDPSMLPSDQDLLYFSGTESEGFPAGSYVLCYYLSGDSSLLRAPQAEARRLGLRLVVIAVAPWSYLPRGGEAITVADCGPREWLALVRGAAVVFTNSFHCTLFAVRFAKQFYTYLQKTRGGRYDTTQRYRELLATFNLERRLLPYGATPTDAAREAADPAALSATLDRLRQEAKAYTDLYAPPVADAGAHTNLWLPL